MASKTDLVIVESPSKAKTIGKYLGPGYEVKASMGHVRDLPKSKMSVDIEGGFIPNYQPIKGKEDVISDLKKAAKKSDRVYLATDPDREGEAISWHLKELLGLQEEHEDYRFNEAYIVSWDSSSWKSTFTIGKGTRSGLETGMVVVTEYGQVVGLITDIGPNWATVTTVLDTSLEISASVASAGYTGVVQGAYTTNASGNTEY